MQRVRVLWGWRVVGTMAHCIKEMKEEGLCREYRQLHNATPNPPHTLPCMPQPKKPAVTLVLPENLQGDPRTAYNRTAHCAGTTAPVTLKTPAHQPIAPALFEEHPVSSMAAITLPPRASAQLAATEEPPPGGRPSRYGCTYEPH